MVFPSELVQALFFSMLRQAKTHTFSVTNSVIEAVRALIFFLNYFFNSSDHLAFETLIFPSQMYPLKRLLKGDATKVILEWKL